MSEIINLTNYRELKEFSSRKKEDWIIDPAYLPNLMNELQTAQDSLQGDTSKMLIVRLPNGDIVGEVHSESDLSTVYDNFHENQRKERDKQLAKKAFKSSFRVINNSSPLEPTIIDRTGFRIVGD